MLYDLKTKINLVNPVQLPDCQQSNTLQCKQFLLLTHLVHDSDCCVVLVFRLQDVVFKNCALLESISLVVFFFL